MRDSLWSLFSEELFVELRVEPDDQGLTFAQCRGAKVSGRTKQNSGERVSVGLVLHFDVRHLLALRCVDLRHGFRELQGIIPRHFRLLRIDNFRDLKRCVRKEPLRSRAARSPTAVIHPVDFGHVGSSCCY